MITKILLGLVAILLAALLWLVGITIPKKEAEVARIIAKADSVENLPPEIQYLPGRLDTLVVRDTTLVEVQAEKPKAQNDSVYTAAYNDGFIKGTISAMLRENRVKSLRFSYSLITPIKQVSRVDTIRIKEFYPKIIPRVAPTQKDWMMLASFSTTYYEHSPHFMFGLDYVARNRKSVGYSYDVSRKIHWAHIRLPLVNKQ